MSPRFAAKQAEPRSRAARAARLHSSNASSEEQTVDRVATGHTRSDQAETVLFRFLRGSGAAGLAGIRPAREAIVHRYSRSIAPRSNITCASAVSPGATDSTNAGSAFARNRIRHELLRN